MCPQNPCSSPNLGVPEPQNVIKFRNEVVAEVRNSDEVMLEQAGPPPRETSGLPKGGFGHRHKLGERHMKKKVDVGVQCPQAEEQWPSRRQTLPPRLGAGRGAGGGPARLGTGASQTFPFAWKTKPSYRRGRAPGSEMIPSTLHSLTVRERQRESKAARTERPDAHSARGSQTGGGGRDPGPGAPSQASPLSCRLRLTPQTPPFHSPACQG